MTELFRGIEYDHFDRLKEKIEYGDSVIYLTAIQRKFAIGHVVGFTERKVIIMTEDGETVRYPHHILRWENKKGLE